MMTAAIRQYQKSVQATIVLRCGYQTERLRIAEIMYCETEREHVKITLHDGSTVMANIGIGALASELTGFNFFRSHKGCLVNLSYIERPLKTDALMRDGTLIPISKHRKKDFMVALMQYWGGQLR